MTYDEVRAILGREPVRALEEAVNDAVIASREAHSEKSTDALELLLTAQLAAVLGTLSDPAAAERALDRAVLRLRVLVADALAVQGVLPADDDMQPLKRASMRAAALN